MRATSNYPITAFEAIYLLRHGFRLQYFDPATCELKTAGVDAVLGELRTYEPLQPVSISASPDASLVIQPAFARDGRCSLRLDLSDDLREILSLPV